MRRSAQSSMQIKKKKKKYPICFEGLWTQLFAK